MGISTLGVLCMCNTYIRHPVYDLSPFCVWYAISHSLSMYYVLCTHFIWNLGYYIDPFIQRFIQLN